MKNTGSDYPELSATEFRDMVLNVMPELGYATASIKVEDEQNLVITAKIASKPVENSVLINVFRGDKKVGLNAVRNLFYQLKSVSASEGVFISTSGFTKSALDYSKGKSIRLLSSSDLKGFEVGKKEALAPAPPEKASDHKIYEMSFKSSKTIEDAKSYFEKKRGKRLFGLLGSEERIVDLTGRFAPVACFELVMENLYDKNLEKRFGVYVNLTYGSIYFMHFGYAFSNPGIRYSGELVKLMRLSPESLRILSEIYSLEEVDPDKMSAESLSTIRNNPGVLLALHNMNLIATHSDAKEVFSNLMLPKFNAERYDLSRYFETESNIESVFEADAIAVVPRDIMAVLSGLLSASISFKGIVYLPYFYCKYVDSSGRSRLDVMFAPDLKKVIEHA